MARVHIAIDDETETKLDRAVALLSLTTGKRQTRTSLIVRALEAELARLEAEAAGRAAPQR